MDPAIENIRKYWNTRIHDQEMTSEAVGSAGFFRDLEAYRYEKLEYLPRVVDFSAFKGQRLLEIGCGIGTDLVRFARGGAQVTGVDLAENAIRLAEKNFQQNGVQGRFLVGNGEKLEFPDGTFDVVYAHGVLQYTANIQAMMDEIHRVLRPGGLFIGMLYNRKGWLLLMSKFFRVDLEHEDAPSFHVYTSKEFRQFMRRFTDVKIIPERFPVRSKLQKGWKALLYNGIFVGLFNAVPRTLVRCWGWHLMGFGTKGNENRA